MFNIPVILSTTSRIPMDLWDFVCNSSDISISVIPVIFDTSDLRAVRVW